MAGTSRMMLMLTVFLHTATITVLAIQGFVLTGPKVLTPGSAETFCVSMEGAHPSANCTLDLMAREDDVVLATVSHRMRGLKYCIKLPVPNTGDETSARLRWRMHFDGRPDYEVENVKEVALRPVRTIDLIQTDKAWYTPAQLVRFRILTLNQFLIPDLTPINRVTIEDPTGSTIAQWTNLTTTHGIHQLEHQLSAEPVQGSWRVVMDRGNGLKNSQEFEVREYVLPKFEVNINPPASISYNQPGDNSVQKIIIGICAKYNFGQPVKGTWTAKVEVTSSGRYYRWRNIPSLPPVDIDRNGVLNASTGCYSLKLSGDQLGITTYDGSIDKTIKVTDLPH